MEELRPKLRALETRWVQVDGEPRLWLRDPLSLSDQVALVPPGLLPLLALLDGSREPGRIVAAFQLQTGVRLPPDVLDAVLAQLDGALLLEGPRLEAARAASLEAYRAAPCRPAALAGHGYPADPGELEAFLSSFVDPAGDGMGPDVPEARGVISPHIDFARGGGVYARTWLPLAEAVAAAELIIVFGTDHAGAPGRLTPTRQHYATPWGSLPTATAWVGRLCEALGGPEAAYAEELHHKNEHSIELAATWLHWAARRVAGERAAPQLLPVLCGSFQPYVGDNPAAAPTNEAHAARAAGVLRAAAASGRTLVVAAADLAHVGPAFGDRAPLSLPDRLVLAAADRRLLETACKPDPAAFLAAIRVERDRRRVCGLPPIYWALHLLEGTVGDLRGYAQCPADERGGSLVTVAGLIYR